MVLAESLVVVDIGVFSRGVSSWRGEVRGRPLGASSENRLEALVETRLASVEGRLKTGESSWPPRSTSVLNLLRSKDGLGTGSSKKRGPAELDGRVGGDGGGPPEICATDGC